MYQNAKLYLNSDKTGFKKVSKSWKDFTFDRFLSLFCRKNETSSGNILIQKLTKIRQNYIFVTFLTQFWSDWETSWKHFKAKKWQKCVKIHIIDSFCHNFVTQRPLSWLKGHQRPSLPKKMCQKTYKSQNIRWFKDDKELPGWIQDSSKTIVR